MQQKFDEVCSGGVGPSYMKFQVQEQVRPQTGAGMSTQPTSSGLQFTNVRSGSVKRASRNTLQGHMTMDSSADPRLVIYNKETIKHHLDKRAKRRAVSNIRPRQRFSTITSFHK